VFKPGTTSQHRVAYLGCGLEEIDEAGSGIGSGTDFLVESRTRVLGASRPDSHLAAGLLVIDWRISKGEFQKVVIVDEYSGLSVGQYSHYPMQHLHLYGLIPYGG